MRFTLVALAACQSLAMRPELGRVAVSKRIASVGDIMSKISSPSDSLAALNEASSLLKGILAEQEPEGATDHISGDDAELLSSVITLVEKTIYSSMDDAHQADVNELDDAVQTASNCNADIAQRQSPDGDLGTLHQAVQDKQTELDRLQGVVDDKTEANNTKYAEFDSHNQMISPPPACPGLPARTMPALDLFFEQSDYVIWYTAQQAAYTVVRDAFVAADQALEDAIQAYNIQKAVRDVQYCDWRSELLAACAAFDTCFSEASDFYTNTLVPSVTSRMNNRIEVKKAGDTLVHQINFLLGEAAEQETPEIDTSRYEIAFPELPEKGLCDLSPLDADEWVPPVSCFDVPHYQSRPAARGQGTCATYQDVLPGDAIGTGSHTIVMSLDFFPAALTADPRQWIFNIGQTTTSANHWLYNPLNQNPPHGVLQFGAWNGPQIKEGPINPSQTLTTTYDGNTNEYSLYIDGKFSSSITVNLNIQNGNMCAGVNCGSATGIDFQGCIRGVDVYREALTANQVQEAASQLEDDVRAGPGKP